MIKINNLSFTYPDGNKALSNIDLNIKEGSTVAIVGANGAGKSTLLSILIGIHLIKDSNIEIAGVSLNKDTLDEIRKKVGYVFQNPDDQLFMARVFDDIAFGPRNFGFSSDEIEEMVTNSIKTLKIEHLKDRASHRLSGGEKRNVALAAVLAMNPEILLLDEPTSFLDPKSRRNLINILKTLSHTKLIATHDLDLVLDICQRVIILKNGEVFADGEPRQLLTISELMEECNMEIPLSLQYKGSTVDIL